MEGTQRTFCKIKVREEVGMVVELVCVMGKVDPSPIMISWDPWYRLWRERLLKSDVMWWDAPLSSSQVEVVLFPRTTWLTHGY